MKIDCDKNIKAFVDILSTNLIQPYINLPTRITSTSKSLIDNIFMTNMFSQTFSGNIITSISDHLPQFLITLEDKKLKKHDILKAENYNYRDWKSFDDKKFRKDFNDVDWDSYLCINTSDNVNINDAFKKFFNIMNNIIDTNVPLKRLTKKQRLSKTKPWITAGIKKSIKQRNFFYKKYLRENNINIKAHYQQLYKFYRNRIVTLIRNSKANHFKNYFYDNIKDSRKVWEGIRELINDNTNKANKTVTLDIDNNITSEPDQVANSFNNHFSTVADKIRNKIIFSSKHFSSYLKKRNENSLFMTPTSPQEIINVIESLNTKKSNGPQSVPFKILDVLKPEVSSILSKLFNLSLQSGIFPSILKTVNVLPIYKNKGSPLSVNNYRPISLLSNIDKIFEKIVKERLLNFLKLNNIIINKQFGFRNKHSTLHALMSLTENIRKNLDKGNYSCEIFIDLQKAFDTVDHKILLSKLDHYGIRGVTNAWFESYLNDRTQSVFVNNSISSKIKIKYGVPQGSVLGPILFLIYINDLLNSIFFSDVFHFADDTSLLYSASSLSKIRKSLNLDLKSLQNWLNSNKISLNALKTQVVLFRHQNKPLNYDLRLKINGVKLQISSFVSYLGVQLDCHLNWNLYTENLSLKLRRCIGILSRLRHSCPKSVLVSVYNALFFSHVSYACQVWGQNTPPNLDRIIKLQKSALRVITFSDFRQPSKPLYIKSLIISCIGITLFQ